MPSTPLQTTIASMASLLSYDGLDPRREGLREALTSTGNGYFCTRGAAEWEESGRVQYPGTYAHGVYNRETTIVGGRPVPNEDLVALPNWLLLQARVGGQELLRLADVEVLEYRHGYDARRALVWRRLRFRDREGRVFSGHSRRFVSMARMHQAAVAWELTAENWSGPMEILSGLDGGVSNRGVARYRQLESRHLNPVSVRTLDPDVIAVETRTRQSGIEVAEAARTRVFRDGQEVEVTRQLHQTEDYVQQVLSFDVTEGESFRVEKVLSLYTSRDRAIDEPLINAIKSVRRYPNFDDALSQHERAWESLWGICDIRFPADEEIQSALRFHASHVLQVCSPLTAHHDAGVPARGLNGEAYRGHVFWDELYVYPFLNFRLPEVTRELLMYRFRRLGEARSAALEAGFRGAMYPWQSGSDGREETQVSHLNPLSNRWEPDVSHLQRHVNSAIFYNIWRYYQATENIHFLRDYGAEMMLQIARFWASATHFNPDRERWEIHGMMGPDEFHTGLPGAEAAGLPNNAYTNIMAAWVFDTAQRLLDMLPTSRREALREKVGLTEDEVSAWLDMSRAMFVPFHGDGIISQFEGYEELEELDWELYRAKHGNVQRLDRILRAEGDDPNRYKVTKQADVLMLFYLFTERELRQLWGRLGYPYDADTARKNIEYYTARTSNGSTLSFVANAAALALIDEERSWGSFRMAIESDLMDVQGGTTQEGIHLAVMAGTLDLVQSAYVGMDVDGEALRFEPRLLDRIDGVSFRMQLRGAYLRVKIEDYSLEVVAEAEGFEKPIEVRVGDAVAELGAGETCAFELERPSTLSER